VLDIVGFLIIRDNSCCRLRHLKLVTDLLQFGGEGFDLLLLLGKS